MDLLRYLNTYERNGSKQTLLEPYSLKQQEKKNPSSRRISTSRLILKDYFANCAIEITVSHAVAYEEDKNQIYWIVC